MKGFKSRVINSIRYFIQHYEMDFYINIEEYSENILDDLFKELVSKNGRVQNSMKY